MLALPVGGHRTPALWLWGWQPTRDPRHKSRFLPQSRWRQGCFAVSKLLAKLWAGLAVDFDLKRVLGAFWLGWVLGFSDHSVQSLWCFKTWQWLVLGFALWFLICFIGFSGSKQSQSLRANFWWLESCVFSLNIKSPTRPLTTCVVYMIPADECLRFWEYSSLEFCTEEDGV